TPDDVRYIARTAGQGVAVGKRAQQVQQAVDIRLAAGDAERDADRADGLVVHAARELLQRELLRPQRGEALIGLDGGILEGELRRAGVAETARAERDVRLDGALLDEPVVDHLPVGVYKVEGDGSAAPGGGLRAVHTHERLPAAVPEPVQPGEQLFGQHGDVAVDALHADAVEEVQAERHGGDAQVVDCAILKRLAGQREKVLL